MLKLSHYFQMELISMHTSMQQRFGKASRNYSNTSVFQHAGRVFSAAENDNPHEIDLENLGTICSWDVGGDWNMPFTAHPKVDPLSCLAASWKLV